MLGQEVLKYNTESSVPFSYRKDALLGQDDYFKLFILFILFLVCLLFVLNITDVPIFFFLPPLPSRPPPPAFLTLLSASMGYAYVLFGSSLSFPFFLTFEICHSVKHFR